MKSKMMERAQMVRMIPGLARMSAQELAALNLDHEAVQEVYATMMADGTPASGTVPGATDGRHPNLSLNGWHVVAGGVKRFYDQLAPLDGLSTTFSTDFQVAGNPHVLPKVEVPVYDNTGSAELDNYASFNTRDSAACGSVEVELHKVDDVITIYAADIAKGIDVKPLVEASISRVANGVQDYVLGKLAVGQAQGDDAAKKITAMEIKAVDNGFSFGYVNQVLSEAIQPRVNAALFNAQYYGALKVTDRDSFNPADLDVDLVRKVQGLAALGTGAVGLLTNKRGAAVAVKAPYMMQGAYASYTQLEHEGQKAPISVCTYYVPELNCLKIVVGAMVGCTVVDVTAVKPLVPAA